MSEWISVSEQLPKLNQPIFLTSFHESILGKGSTNISNLLLNILGLEEEKIPRFRDIYLHDNKIVVYTRTGGGNRLEYDSYESLKEHYPIDAEEATADRCYNSYLRENEHYILDEDDDFDCTYANFFFKFPEEHKESLEKMCEIGWEEQLKSDKWRDFFKNLENSISNKTEAP